MDPLLSALVAAGLLTQADAERMARQMDPAAARAYAEQVLTAAFQRGLTAQQRRVLNLLDRTDGVPTDAELDRLWQGETALMWASVRDNLIAVALERAISARVAMGANTWNLVNEQVTAWADDYYLDADGTTYGSIPNLNLTSRTQFVQAFTEWQNGDLERAGYVEGLPQLIRALTPTFGPSRAAAISITETTRIFSFAEMAAGDANPEIYGYLYRTANDERVTDLCRSGDGLVMRKGAGTFPDGLGAPPRHVRCRSTITAITEAAYRILQREGMAQ